jgi:hypothetical protein
VNGALGWHIDGETACHIDEILAQIGAPTGAEFMVPP